MVFLVASGFWEEIVYRSPQITHHMGFLLEDRRYLLTGQVREHQAYAALQIGDGGSPEKLVRLLPRQVVNSSLPVGHFL